MAELKEKRNAQSKDLEVLQEEQATLNNKLLGIFDIILKEVIFYNVLRQLESLVHGLQDFHDSFSFV